MSTAEDNCNTCCWLKHIPNKRDDEPSAMLCRSSHWGGYIIDPAKPACEGVQAGRRTLLGWWSRLPTDAPR